VHFVNKALLQEQLSNSNMKVSNSAVKAIEGKESKMEIPPLSLIPDDEELEESDTTKKISFKLYTNPNDTDHSPKYSFSVAIADGSQSIRFQIKWADNVKKILRGLNVTEGDGAHEIVQQLCMGQIKTQYMQTIKEIAATHLLARVNHAVSNFDKR
jgi:hypothetical protein